MISYLERLIEYAINADLLLQNLDTACNVMQYIFATILFTDITIAETLELFEFGYEGIVIPNTFVDVTIFNPSMFIYSYEQDSELNMYRQWAYTTIIPAYVKAIMEFATNLKERRQTTAASAVDTKTLPSFNDSFDPLSIEIRSVNSTYVTSNTNKVTEEDIDMCRAFFEGLKEQTDMSLAIIYLSARRKIFIKKNIDLINWDLSVKYICSAIQDTLYANSMSSTIISDTLIGSPDGGKTFESAEARIILRLALAKANLNNNVVATDEINLLNTSLENINNGVYNNIVNEAQSTIQDMQNRLTVISKNLASNLDFVIMNGVVIDNPYEPSEEEVKEYKKTMMQKSLKRIQVIDPLTATYMYFHLCTLKEFVDDRKLLYSYTKGSSPTTTAFSSTLHRIQTRLYSDKSIAQVASWIHRIYDTMKYGGDIPDASDAFARLGNITADQGLFTRMVSLQQMSDQYIDQATLLQRYADGIKMKLRRVSLAKELDLDRKANMEKIIDVLNEQKYVAKSKLEEALTGAVSFWERNKDIISYTASAIGSIYLAKQYLTENKAKYNSPTYEMMTDKDGTTTKTTTTTSPIDGSMNTVVVVTSTNGTVTTTTINTAIDGTTETSEKVDVPIVPVVVPPPPPPPPPPVVVMMTSNDDYIANDNDDDYDNDYDNDDTTAAANLDFE